MEKEEGIDQQYECDYPPFHLKPFSNIEPQEGKFKTGRNLWEEGKLHYKYNICEENKPFHERIAQMDFLQFLLNSGMNEDLRANVIVKYSDAIRSVNTPDFLSLHLTHFITLKSLAPLALFISFNQAIIDIFTITDSAVQKALYVKGDLIKLQSYFVEVMGFFKQAKRLTKTLYGLHPQPFDKNKFEERLRKETYIRADTFAEKANAYINQVHTDYRGIIGIHNFIIYYSNCYYLVFKNQYFFIKAHLEDRKNPDKRYLNRRHKGALDQFRFNLIDCSLPDLEKLEKYRNPPEQAELTRPKKKKRRPRKKKAPVLNQASQIQATNNTLITEPIEMGISSVLPDNEQQEALRIIGDFSEEKTPSEAPTVDSQDKGKEKLRDIGDELPEILPSILPEPQSTRKNAQVNMQIANNSILKKIHQLSGLNNILEQFDGGAHKGMKTRHFLKLAEALNSLGYFSDFKANLKEVRMNITPDKNNPQGRRTVMHMGHSNRRKEKNVSGKTASKMNEVIDILKKKEGTQE